MRTFMFRGGFALGILAGVLVVSGPAWSQGSTVAKGQQATRVPCGPTQQIRDKLIEKYGELQRSIGLARGGTVVLEIYAGEDGSWTAITTSVSGKSCVLMNGSRWMDVRAPAIPGMGM